MKKTYSQKVAGVFEIICYVLLVPTGLSLIYPALFVVGGMTEGKIALVFWGLLPFFIVLFGLILLVGYRKHSRDRLDEKFVPSLWLTTAVYNFLLLLPWLFAAATGLQSQRDFPNMENLVRFFITATAVFGYIAAITSSIKAYSFAKRRQKYS